MALGREKPDETYWMLCDLVVMTSLVENIKGKYKDHVMHTCLNRVNFLGLCVQSWHINQGHSCLDNTSKLTPPSTIENLVIQ